MSRSTHSLSGSADNDEEAALWSAFKTGGSTAARERLFSLHAAFARSIARRHYREQARGDLELADVVQLAHAGLLEALDRFDPQYGTPFRPFAAHRISGSIRDGLSKMSELREQISWRHRVRRERLRSLAQANTEKMNTGEAMEALADIAVGLALGFMLEGTGFFEQGDGSVQGPDATGYDSLAWKETVAQLHLALATLPEREQTILRQHYLHGVSFDQLASLLEITKGRASQLHRAALLVLKRRLRERGHFRLEK